MIEYLHHSHLVLSGFLLWLWPIWLRCSEIFNNFSLSRLKYDMLSNSIIELDNFCQEIFSWLFIELLAALNHLDHQVSVVNFWSLNPWEKIRNNILEQGEIILQELRNIDIS